METDSAVRTSRNRKIPPSTSSGRRNQVFIFLCIQFRSSLQLGWWKWKVSKISEFFSLDGREVNTLNAGLVRFPGRKSRSIRNESFNCWANISALYLGLRQGKAFSAGWQIYPCRFSSASHCYAGHSVLNQSTSGIEHSGNQQRHIIFHIIESRRYPYKQGWTREVFTSSQEKYLDI